MLCVFLYMCERKMKSQMAFLKVLFIFIFYDLKHLLPFFNVY